MGAMTWVLDLDGVLWLAGRPLPGAPEAVARLRQRGHRVVFVTNNSGPTLADHLRTLLAAGVAADEHDVLTSEQAAAGLLEPGTRVLVVGGAGVREALVARGVELVEDAPEAVVVGRTVEFDYDMLTRASTAIRDGARF